MDFPNTFYALFDTQNLGVDKFAKKWYYIAYVELLTSQIFGDTYVQNPIGSILNWWFWVPYETKPTFAVEMVYI